jgi:hypothetical protein
VAVKLCASRNLHDGIFPGESPMCHNICRVVVLKFLVFHKFEENGSENATADIL